MKAAREVFNDEIIAYIISISRNFNLSGAITKTGINAELLKTIKDGTITYGVEKSIINTETRTPTE